MKFNTAIDIMEKIAPLEYGADWDNSGVQVYTGKEEIQKILFCLEINDDVIEEAVQTSADLIVTHHPLLFNKASKVDIDDVVGRYLIKLVKNDIAVYSSHIPFDNAPLGNNYYMAKLLKLENVDEVSGEVGVIGELPYEMKFAEMLEHIEESLALPKNYIRAVGNNDMYINKVALCTGAGGDLLYRAYSEKCDMLITGDVKLNVAQDAKAMGMALVDAGHYGTEKSFSENCMAQFKEILEDMDISGVELNVAEANTNPYITI